MIGAGITPQRTSVERKARRGARERDVAAGDHADAAAVAGALDQRERRPREGVQRAHGERRAARERHVVLERVACDLAQPGEISAGLEVLAVRAQNQQAHAAIGGERAHRLAQGLDHRAVVGVVHFGPVERKRGDARARRPRSAPSARPCRSPCGQTGDQLPLPLVLTTIAGRVQPAVARPRCESAGGQHLK